MIQKQDGEIMLKVAQRLFTGCHVVLATDPEDKDISYVRVYGVPDTEVKSARRQLWNAIEELAETIDVDSFVPSVVSASDTAAFYPAFMPIPLSCFYGARHRKGTLPLSLRCQAPECLHGVRHRKGTKISMAR